MSRADLEAVVRLACQTEDRAPSEQRALLSVAVRLELDLNGSTSENLRSRFGGEPSTVVDLVEASYCPSEGKPVTLKDDERSRLLRAREAFAVNVACIDRHGYQRRTA